jgi:hypothetical protein
MGVRANILEYVYETGFRKYKADGLHTGTLSV